MNNEPIFSVLSGKGAPCDLDYYEEDPNNPSRCSAEYPYCYCNTCQAENPFTNQDSSNGCPDCLSRTFNCCYQSYYKENPGTGSCIPCIEGPSWNYGPSCSSVPECPFALTLEECESFDWVDYYAQ